MPTLVAERRPRAVADPWEAHHMSSHIPNAELQRVMDDADRGIGLFGTFATAKEAMIAMRKAIAEMDDEETAFCTP